MVSAVPTSSGSTSSGSTSSVSTSSVSTSSVSTSSVSTSSVSTSSVSTSSVSTSSAPAATGPPTPDHGSSTKSFTPTSWNHASSTYSQRVGRMSFHAARRLVSLTHALLPYTANPSASATNSSIPISVLDLGTGTGPLPIALTTLFLPNPNPGTPTSSIPILATDISPGMLKTLTSLRLPNVTTRILDACHLSTSLPRTQKFSHILSTFMLQFVPNPLSVISQIHARSHEGGVIGIGIWTRANGPINFWTQACTTLDPAYAPPNPFHADAWRDVAEVEAALREVGFQDVRGERLAMPFEFEDTEAFLRFWFEGENPVARRLVAAWTERWGQRGREEVRRVMGRLVDGAAAGGRGIVVEAGLVVGRR